MIKSNDIELFGFKFLPKKSLLGLNNRYLIEGLYKRILDGYDDTMWWNVYLKHYPDRNVITITGDISDGSKNEKFFEGVINNIEELEWVLNSLGILRDD